MKTTTILFMLPLFILLNFSCKPTYTGTENINPPEGYKLIWAEEFDTDGKPD